jgi:type III secretion protein T
MEDGYISLVVNMATDQEKLLNLLGLMFLFVGRIFPILTLSPFFGGKVLPRPIKVCFGISLFAIMLPRLLEVTTSQFEFNIWLGLLLMKELFIGFLLGFTFSLPFTMVQNAGVFIDNQRGGASLMVNDPTLQNQSSPLGTIFNMVLIVLFYNVGGPMAVIEAVLNSFEILPLDQIPSPAFFAESSPFRVGMISMYNKLLVISVQLAAPGLMMIFLTDVFLGIANRLAPQVQVTFLGLPLKSFLALAIVAIGWELITSQFVQESINWVKYSRSLIQYLGM